LCQRPAELAFDAQAKLDGRNASAGGA